MSELSLRIAALGITMSYTHLGFNTCPAMSNMDDWSVILTYKGRECVTEYHTGVGHRKLHHNVVKRGSSYSNNGKYAHSDLQAVKMGYLVLRGAKDPTPAVDVADVVNCMMMDASAIGVTFEDWCGDFGYNSDSRKMLALYLQCQENGANVLKLLGREVFDSLVGLEH